MKAHPQNQHQQGTKTWHSEHSSMQSRALDISGSQDLWISRPSASRPWTSRPQGRHCWGSLAGILFFLQVVYCWGCLLGNALATLAGRVPELCVWVLSSGPPLAAPLNAGSGACPSLALLLKDNSRKSPCPPAVPFLHWPQCQATPASPVWMSSSCSSISSVAASISPAVLLPSLCCVSLVLSFSSPLVLRSRLGVLPSCCPVVLLELSGHSLAFFCPLGVFILFSFPHPFALCCPPHVLLWSFCCPAIYVAVQSRGWGRGPTTTTTILAD